MNDILDLLPVPASREMPHGRLEERRELVVQFVAADLADRKPTRAGRWTLLRTWLMAVGLLIVVITVAASLLVASHGRASTTRTAVEAAAAGSTPIVLAVAASSSSDRANGGMRKRVLPERLARDTDVTLARWLIST